MRPARRRALVVWALPLAAAWPTAGVAGGPERTPTFVHDVLPLLQRQGCASAYCHGAATGQGGFKLSLFGGEPEADYAAIVRALGGRRLDLHQPDASLLLLKPMRKVEHGGGKRITAGSFAHQRLAAWIAAGAPFAAPPERRLASLTVRLASERLAVDAMFATGA